MKQKHTPIGLEKCDCGDAICNKYGTTDGIFYQGSGYDKETAEFHVRACNAHDDMVAAIRAMIDPKVSPELSLAMLIFALAKATEVQS